MKVGSLFSGIGGFDLGLERAGMMVAWQVEIDEYCRKLLSKHWPDVPKYGDIRECGAHNLEAVDLVCGGFPCQPFSYAGKRQGKGDDRFLWPEMLRVISEIRPRWVIGENVIGLLNLEIESVLSDLEGAGYSTQPIIIPACAINAPHRRERIWILAHYDESSRGSEHGKQQTERATIFSPGSAGNVADAEGKRLQGEWAKRQQEPEAHGTTAIPLWGGSIRDMWEVEPDMVRVADGVSFELDIIRGIEREYSNSKKTITEIEVAIRRILFYVWEHQESAKTSPKLYRRGLLDCPNLPYQDTSQGWLLGKRIEVYEGLRDLWYAFYSSSQQETQDLQSQLLERIRKTKRPKEVASRVGRLRALGNAVVPQIPEIIGRMILEIENPAGGAFLAKGNTKKISKEDI